VKAITLYQPWAFLVAWGFKTLETRSWGTPYKGELAIHAAAGKPRWDLFVDPKNEELARETVGACTLRAGSVLAVAHLDGVLEIDGFTSMHMEESHTGLEIPDKRVVQQTSSLLGYAWKQGKTRPRGAIALGDGTSRSVRNEFAFGDLSMGRWAWQLSRVVVMHSDIPCRGRQALWNVPDDVVSAIRAHVIDPTF
jgi:hypothetical protein